MKDDSTPSPSQASSPSSQSSRQPQPSKQPQPDDFLDVPDFLVESTYQSGRKGEGTGQDGNGRSKVTGSGPDDEPAPRKLLLGIGNELKGDDIAGNLVARRFCAAGWRVEDCGTVPENFTAIVRRMRPDVTVMVDASMMELEPGAIRKVPGERIGIMNFSTHSLPLTIFMDYIRKYSKEIVTHVVIAA